MTNGVKPEGEEKSSAGRNTRGPSYPALSVEEAIERAQQFYAREKRSAAPIAAAAGHWGYSENSSSVRLIVAALIQYGLLEDAGSGAQRTVKLTGRALDIVLDEPNSPSRLAAIQAAVRAPRMHAEVFARWEPSELPSDQTVRFFLVREKAFNDSAVDGFIKNLRDSISFARMGESSKMEEVKRGGDEEKPKEQPDPKRQPEVGDLVQWEANGVLRLETPRKVRAKREHEGSWWVFIEDSETGIPMEEAVVVERAESEQRQKSPPVLPLEAQPEKAIVSKGEREWLRGPLSKEVNYRLIVNGDMGSKEIGKLIKLLEAQKLVLDDDE